MHASQIIHYVLLAVFAVHLAVFSRLYWVRRRLPYLLCALAFVALIALEVGRIAHLTAAPLLGVRVTAWALTAVAVISFVRSAVRGRASRQKAPPSQA